MPVALWEANLLLSPIIHHLARHIVDKVRERVQFTCISFRISSQHMIYVAHVLLLTILRKTLIFISADLWNAPLFLHSIYFYSQQRDYSLSKFIAIDSR